MMLMEERQQWRSWRIDVHGTNFNFKLRAATNLVPNCNFSRFSFSLKLRKFAFKLDSDPIASIPQKNTSLKTSVIKFLKRFSQKFLPRIAKKGPILIKRTSNFELPKLQDPIGITILSCVGYLVAPLIKTCKRGKHMIINIAVVLVLIAALSACFKFLNLENYYWDFMENYASEPAKMAWNRFS